MSQEPSSPISDRDVDATRRAGNAVDDALSAPGGAGDPQEGNPLRPPFLPPQARFKTVKRTEEYKEPVGANRRLPEGDDLSRDEENAILSSRDIDVSTLVELIGKPGREDWKIEVQRKGPPNYRGFAINMSKVATFRSSMKWDEVEEWLRVNRGGGEYEICIIDGRRKCIRARRMEIEGDPILQSQENPGAFGVQDGGGAQTESERIRAAREELAVAKYKAELEEITSGKKGGDNAALVSMISSFMDRSERAAADSERRHQDEIRAMREQQARPAQGWDLEKIVGIASAIATALKAIMPTPPPPAPDMTERLLPILQDNTRMMIDVMKSSHQPQVDRSFDIFKIISDTQIQKAGMEVKLLDSLLPILADRGKGDDEDEDRIVRIIKTVGPLIDKGLDMFRLGSEIKKLQAIHAAPALPQGGATPPAAAPAAGSPPPAANPDAASQQKATIAQLVSEREQEYSAQGEDAKISYLIRQLVTEAPFRPVPDRSLFCHLVLMDNTPDFILDFLLDQHNAMEMRNNIYEMIRAEEPNSEAIAKIESIVFSHAERSDWVSQCLAYLHVALREYAKERAAVEAEERRNAGPSTAAVPPAEPGATSTGAALPAGNAGSGSPPPAPPTPDQGANSNPEGKTHRGTRKGKGKSHDGPDSPQPQA